MHYALRKCGTGEESTAGKTRRRSGEAWWEKPGEVGQGGEGQGSRRAAKEVSVAVAPGTHVARAMQKKAVCAEEGHPNQA